MRAHTHTGRHHGAVGQPHAAAHQLSMHITQTLRVCGQETRLGDKTRPCNEAYMAIARHEKCDQRSHTHTSIGSRGVAQTTTPSFRLQRAGRALWAHTLRRTQAGSMRPSLTGKMWASSVGPTLNPSAWCGDHGHRWPAELLGGTASRRQNHAWGWCMGLTSKKRQPLQAAYLTRSQPNYSC